MAVKRRKGITAWLVRWEHVGEHARPPRKFVAAFSSRWSSERVKEQVELLYAQLTFSISDQLLFAKSKSFNPYPCRLTCPQGIPFSNYLACGHNPFLYARLVDNLRMEGEYGDEGSLRWDDRPLPENVAEIRRSLGITSDESNSQ